MDVSPADFLKKAEQLKERLESEVKSEFLQYIEDLKLESRAAATSADLVRHIKAAVQALSGSPKREK